MAVFVYGDAMGDFGELTDVVNPNALSPVEQTTTLDRYEDPEGDGVEAVGTGFLYSGLLPAAGNMTGLNAFTAADAPLLTVTGLNLQLNEFYLTLTIGGLDAAVLMMTVGDDQFTGSSNADLLYSGEGNDRVKGFGGGDIIAGGTGRDVLTGGKGADDFLFYRGDGRDRITDFTDTGARGDDQIALTAKMYSVMVATDTASGVELSFGRGDVLLVEGWLAANVGADDFLIT